MHEIRKNKEREEIIIEAIFRMPKPILAFFVISNILLAVLIIAGIVTLALGEVGIGLAFLLPAFVTLINLNLIFAFALLLIKKRKCVITNKRIFGETYFFFFIKRRFSYRLDEIDNVEAISILGLHGIVLNFTQGHTVHTQNVLMPLFKYGQAKNELKVNWIANIDEMYQKTFELITTLKNERDILVDMEMSKILVDKKKTQAFENIANSISNSMKQLNTFIELKNLKELRDLEVITKEEFEKKKSDLSGFLHYNGGI